MTKPTFVWNVKWDTTNPQMAGLPLAVTLAVTPPDIESARAIVKTYREQGFEITLHPMHMPRTKSTSEALIGAVVVSVVEGDGCIDNIQLKQPNGEYVYLWAEGEGGTEGRVILL